LYLLKNIKNSIETKGFKIKNKLLDKSLEVFLKIDCLLKKLEGKGVISSLSSMEVFDLMIISLQQDIETVNQMKNKKTYKQKDWK